MYKNLLTVMCGAAAMLAVAAVPASAADALETKLQSCNACHGADGRPVDASLPIIWGQTTAYLTKQMHDFRGEDRSSPVMSPIAATIEPQEWRKVAAYFTAKAWPARTTPAPAAAASASPPDGMAVCRACHQQNFEGGLPAPRLAGQSYEYLLAAMNSFADDKRTNSEDMAKLMKGLTASQRDAMARYLAGL
jgi:cytochrome c553